MNKVLNFQKGRRTYIVAILMVLHSGSQIVMDLLNGQMPDQLVITELFAGLGFAGLRAAK